MVKIFTKSSSNAYIFAAITTLLLSQIVVAQAPVKKREAPKNPAVQVYPSNQVKTYPANNDLPLVDLITMQEAIKNSGYMRITEAKLTTYGEYAAKTGEYKKMYSNNRMIWMITGYVPGRLSEIKGRFTCIAGARIITLIDAETGDGFGRSINCPPGNVRSTMSIP
jgi:hypothetical protein